MSDSIDTDIKDQKNDPIVPAAGSPVPPGADVSSNPPVVSNPMDGLLRPGADAPKDESIIISAVAPASDVPPPVPEPEKVVSSVSEVPSVASVNQEKESIPPAEPPPAPVVGSVPASDPLVVPSKDQPHEDIQPPQSAQYKPKNKGGKKGMLVGLVLLFLLVSTGLVFVFVNQQQSLNDIRNRATAPGVYPGVNSREACLDGGGEVVTEPGSECGCGGYRVECVMGGQHYFIKCETNPNAECGGGENTPTPTPRNSNTPTQTPTVTPTGTITVTLTPTVTPTGTITITQTPTVTPTGTPSVTLTPTPTQIVYAACNYACTVNADCGGGLVCLDKVCRNASCVDSASCSCGGAAPTPKIPVAGTGPSVLGATAIVGGFFMLLLGLLF
jgi:hypothetical protein